MRAPAPIATQPYIDGVVSAGFEGVRQAFVENFAHRGEVGAACCIYRHGEKVVDLWGGVRNRAGGEPWQPDTMVVVHSASKGLAAMTLALAHSRGWLDYDERVAAYWPEFARRTSWARALAAIRATSRCALRSTLRRARGLV